MNCQCSICRGVVSVDPQTYVTQAERPSVADLLRELGLPNTISGGIRMALVELLELRRTTRKP